MFFKPTQHPVALIQRLNVAREGAYVIVDEHLRTSSPMLWAAGDLCSPMMQQVVMAAAQGGRAAAMIDATLAMGKLPHPSP